ncbi:MAG TPA: hypothetical protein VJ385_20620 [Fibrobacteria bacterium]|nr:hypothetical protein [Fibrobacteria bacterium]
MTRPNDVLRFPRRLKGWKASAVELRENELVLEFAGKGGPSRLVLKGIIGSRDAGLIGRALVEYRIEDKGSYKQIAFIGLKGRVLFLARFLEGEFR